MDSTWFEILVIIQAVLLIVFLVLTIFLIIKVIQIIKVVKRITEHAEHMADKAEHIASFFEKTATPVAIMKIISNVNDVISKKRRKK